MILVDPYDIIIYRILFYFYVCFKDEAQIALF